MPKRAKTPPPPDDAKYLTVVTPYPLNPNWELPLDRVSFARWIACVLGGYEPFFSFYHKPTQGMVIIEIDKEYENWNALLGEHRWSEFLQKPTDEEMERKSQIFYCIYSSDREAQKDGWKRVTVDEQWFGKDKWSVRNRVIYYPYPPTHWCETPPEDATNKKLCRPLPVSATPNRAPPPKITPPVVGSSAWANSKSTSPVSPNQRQQALRGAWGARGRGGTPSTRGAAAPTVRVPRAWGPQHPTAKNTVVDKTSPSSADTLSSGSSIKTNSNLPPDLISSTASSSSSFQTMTSPLDEKRSKKPSIPIVGDDDDDESDDGMGANAVPKTSNVMSARDTENSEVWSPPISQPKPQELCPVHGIICKKGICAEMSRVKSEKAKAERKAKKDKEREDRMSKAESKQGSKKGWRNMRSTSSANKSKNSVTPPSISSRSSDIQSTSRRSSPPPPSSDDDKNGNGSEAESAPTTSSKGVAKIDNPWDGVEQDDEW